VRAELNRLSPRIGRSLALSRPWSASTALLTGMKISASPVRWPLTFRVGCWLAYGATVRDRGAGSEAGWAGRCYALG
jgi:hypothetical protein